MKETLHRVAKKYRLAPTAMATETRPALHHESGSHEPHLKQAMTALATLEQRPESFASLVRFRQALEMLRALHYPLPVDLLRRALVVRTVGGENLSFVRLVLDESLDCISEHICMARREAVHAVLALPDRNRAYQILAHNLAHPNPAVKLTAIYGHARLRDPRILPALLALAQDTRSPLRDDARRLAFQMGGEQAEACVLLRAAHEGDPPRELLRSSRPPVREEVASLPRPAVHPAVEVASGQE